MSKETISRITDRVLDGMAEWQSRPLDAVYPVIFIDAIQVKIRDGQVANRPIYVALGVSCDGERDILGLWAAEHGDGEGAKFWLRVLTEIKNRGVADVCMIVCDGLKGACPRRSRRPGRPRSPRRALSIWGATRSATRRRGTGPRSPAISSRSTPRRTRPPRWTGSPSSARNGRPAARRSSSCGPTRGPSSCPLLGFNIEIRKLVCTTNAIESLNARLRRSVRARGHFPTEQAAMKWLYMTVISLDPTGRGRRRWSNRWKAALNAFEITFNGRLSAGRK